jgi:hypothetical protein
MLGVNGDPTTAGQAGDINPVAVATEAGLGNRVDKPFPPKSRADSRLGQNVDRSWL